MVNKNNINSLESRSSLSSLAISSKAVDDSFINDNNDYYPDNKLATSSADSYDDSDFYGKRSSLNNEIMSSSYGRKSNHINVHDDDSETIHHGGVTTYKTSDSYTKYNTRSQYQSNSYSYSYPSSYSNHWADNIKIGDIIEYKRESNSDEVYYSSISSEKWVEARVIDVMLQGNRIKIEYPVNNITLNRGKMTVIENEKEKEKEIAVVKDVNEAFDDIENENYDNSNSSSSAMEVDSPRDSDYETKDNYSYEELGGKYEEKGVDSKDGVSSATTSCVALVAVGEAYDTYDEVDTRVLPRLSHLIREKGRSGGGYNHHHDYPRFKNTEGTPMVQGGVGLVNLGNTCFMNSILQCLSHTKQLTEHFLSGRYAADINTSNPLGMGGKIANSYANLMTDIWSSKYVKVAPTDFKDVIGTFKPQFVGYQQQDSQEFMGFLLDGLHEDLNRVVQKPFVPNIESNGRPDDLIARESLRRYLLRNNSELVENMFGQCRSHLTCTNCGNVSVKFEQYSSLSLSIPVKQTKSVPVIVQLLPLGSKPVKVELEYGPLDVIKDLKVRVLRRLREEGYLLGDEDAAAVDTSNFQLATMFSMHYSMSKKLVGDTANAANIVYGAAESLLMFQLPSSSPSSSPPPPPPSSSSSSSSSSSLPSSSLPSSSSSVSTKENDSDTVERQTIDVFHTHMSPYGNSYNVYYSNGNKPSKRREKFGLPMRLRYDPSTTTNADMLRLIKEIAKSKVLPEYTAVDADGCNIRIVKDPVSSNSKDNNDDDNNNNNNSSSSVNSSEAFEKGEGEGEGEGEWTSFTDVAYTSCTAIGYLGDNTSSIPNNDELFVNGFPKPDSYANAYYKDPSIFITWSDSSKDYIDMAKLSSGSAYTKDDFPVMDIAVIGERKRTSTKTNDGDGDDDGGGMSDKGGLHIYSLLKKYVEQEKLTPEEAWYCSKCKEHNEAIKKLDLWSTPDVLIVHLKRFLYTPVRIKISEHVDFPISGLDLSPYLLGPIDRDAPPIYDLYAVSEHSGGMSGGHYTSLCKKDGTTTTTTNSDDNGNSNSNGADTWYKLNDGFVSPCASEADKVVTDQAYVLFYKRRNGKLKWGGVQPLSEEEQLSDE